MQLFIFNEYVVSRAASFLRMLVSSQAAEEAYEEMGWRPPRIGRRLAMIKVREVRGSTRG